jgi:flavin reductase (DIM6/NTAB) family NADH-FMN oxidoreductase RutF
VNGRIAGAAAFKQTMRRYPTGVTVVTSVKEGEPRGITLTAFSSVSAEPPMLSICVNREARSYLYISTSRIFCVNLLAVHQRDLAERFSGKVRERQFEEIGYGVGATGAPILRGTVGYFDCTVEHEHHVGTHSIFVGLVVACESRPGSPLGYYDGAFRDFGLRAEQPT